MTTLISSQNENDMSPSNKFESGLITPPKNSESNDQQSGLDMIMCTTPSEIVSPKDLSPDPVSRAIPLEIEESESDEMKIEREIRESEALARLLMAEEAEKLLTNPAVKEAYNHFLFVCALTKEKEEHVKS